LRLGGAAFLPGLARGAQIVRADRGFRRLVLME
jgi:hypothetical protein